MAEQERLEASLSEKSVKLVTGSILPLLLVALLGWNAWLVYDNSGDVGDATNAAAKFTIQEIRAYLDREIQAMRILHADRAREHDAMSLLINDIVSRQNNMFLEFLNKKSVQDTMQHGAIERAIARACRAQEKAFQENRLMHLAQRAAALKVNAGFIAHLYEREELP